MDTVNVQCGHCGLLMAISTEHLGTQVACPHCHGVVEAPAADVADVDTRPEITVPGSDSVASILGAPENEASDDIFGTARKPLVELPPELPAKSPAEGPSDGPTETFGDRPSDKEGAPGVSDAGAATWLETKPEPEGEAGALPDVAPRTYARKRSMLVPILLIFLIPYSIFSTAFIAWLLYTRNKAGDPMEFLRDPDPKRDGPERKGKSQGGQRVKWDARLPANLRVALHKTLQIGDVEVTPIKLQYQSGDLSLHLRLRNLSSDVAFNPLPDSFADPKTFGSNHPYTFLDAGNDDYIFGGFVDHRRAAKDGLTAGARLDPGEEMVAVLTTRPEDRGKVRALVKSNKELVWRVQIRRGLVMVDDAPRSATAVIGVEFPARAIERPAASS